MREGNDIINLKLNRGDGTHISNPFCMKEVSELLARVGRGITPRRFFRFDVDCR